MFRIEFDGKVLPGFEPQIVRLEVAVRLRLRDAQVERLFSGRTVILKKQVHARNSVAYLNELRSMGLDARLVPLDDFGAEEAALVGPCKAVFWGRTLPEFNRTAVMTAAVRKLRVSPAQLKQVFSGVKVVLKRGLSVEDGRMFVAEMAGLGMQLELEPDELPPLPEAAPVATAPAAPAAAEAASQAEDAAFGALLNTACDLSGTPFAGYDTSSEFARDDSEETVMVVPPPMPQIKRAIARDGFDAANQDGYLNCPHCGRYQAAAEVCVSCGGIMPPQRKLFVGKAGEFVDNSPTTLVTPEHGRARHLHPEERPRQRPSLEEQLEKQMERPGRSGGTRQLIVAALLLVLVCAAAAGYLFLRR